MKTIEFKDRAGWRSWLEKNHDSVPEIWLVYEKHHSGSSTLEYEASIEEALCYGWVDSIIKKIDEQKYARKFTPRKPDSKWSVTNKRRVEKLIREGSMTTHGMKAVEEGRRSGNWDHPVQRPKFDLSLPEEFRQALQANEQARNFFDGLAQSHRKQYILWIVTAKMPETKEKRIRESIGLLERGQKLGLK